jgi:hypothetical protein
MSGSVLFHVVPNLKELGHEISKSLKKRTKYANMDVAVFFLIFKGCFRFIKQAEIPYGLCDKYANSLWFSDYFRHELYNSIHYSDYPAQKVDKIAGVILIESARIE